MGKGDKRSAKGKRIIGSSGVTRQKKKDSYIAPEVPVEKVVATKEKKAAKKPAAKKTTAKKPAAKKD